MKAQTLLLWLVSIISGMLLSAFLLLVLFKIDVVARGYGEVIPATRVQIKLEPQSVISEVVKKSGPVQQDEIILRLTRTTAESELARAEKEIQVLEAEMADVVQKVVERQAQAKARIAKAQAELAGAHVVLEELKKSPLAQQIAAAEEQLKQEQIQLAASETVLSDTAKLYKQGLVSKMEYDEKQKQYDLAVSKVEEKKNELAQLKAKLERSDLAKATAEENRAKAELELAKMVESSEQEIQTLKARIEKAKIERDMCAHELEKRDVRAPISGELVGFDAVGPGERTLTSSPPVGEIIDRSTTIFKAMIPEQDIPDVQVGQRAIIYLDAYPYRKFREFEGRVLDISPVAQRLPGLLGGAALCEVKIQLDGVPGYEFKPGMRGETEIIVGRERAIKWLLGIEENRERKAS